MQLNSGSAEWGGALSAILHTHTRLHLHIQFTHFDIIILSAVLPPLSLLHPRPGIQTLKTLPLSTQLKSHITDNARSKVSKSNRMAPVTRSWMPHCPVVKEAHVWALTVLMSWSPGLQSLRGLAHSMTLNYRDQHQLTTYTAVCAALTGSHLD